MKIKFIACVLLLALAFLCALTAQNDYYTVVKGDSLWKIAVKYQVGLSEIIGEITDTKSLAHLSRRHRCDTAERCLGALF